MLGDLVAASDSEIDAAFANEGRNVGGGQEDQRDGQVLDQRDVEAGFATELDVTAGEEIEGCLLQTSFCIVGFSSSVLGSLTLFLGSCSCGYRGPQRSMSHDLRGNLLLGTAKRRRPSKLFRISVLVGISMRFVIEVDSLVDEIHGDRAVRRGGFHGFLVGE